MHTQFCIFAAICLCLAGCRRAPQTAAELQEKLPHQFRGDLTLQGDSQPHHIVVEPHEMTLRNAHLLGFDRVRYQIMAGTEVVAEGDAGIRGTISAPDLEIRLEQVTDAGEAGGGEALKADTFKGQLSADLQTAQAEWTSGYGQRVTLKVSATAAK